MHFYWILSLPWVPMNTLPAKPVLDMSLQVEEERYREGRPPGPQTPEEPLGPDLDISVGEPFIIAQSDRRTTWGYYTFPILQKINDETLMLGFSTGEDAFLSFDREPGRMISTDRGQTWQVHDSASRLQELSPEMVQALREPGNEATAFALGLSSGCHTASGWFLSTFYHTMRVEPGRFVNSLWRTREGQTWEGPVDIFFDVPGHADDPLGRGPAPWQRAVQEADGDLLVTAHARFAGEEKLRVIVLRSRDKGRHWEYLATVAYDPHLPTEGFTEPVLTQLAQGDLLVVMRTEGHQPLMQSRSFNGGRTWTPPQPTGVAGVAPDLHLLSNGVLACSYGRPGNNLMFSADGTGRVWTHHTALFDYGAAPHSSGYTSFCEIEPGVLLFVFDTINWQPEGAEKPVNCVRGVRVTVQPREKGKEVKIERK